MSYSSKIKKKQILSLTFSHRDIENVYQAQLKTQNLKFDAKTVYSFITYLPET
jgi:hypothetical protein